MADNFHFDITSREREHFLVGVKLAFSEYRAAVAFSVTSAGALAVYWSNPAVGVKLGATTPPQPWGEIRKLSYEMKESALAEFAWHWLQDSAQHGEEPDIDGHCEKGFRIYMPKRTSASPQGYTMLVVQPEWLEYHK